MLRALGFLLIAAAIALLPAPARADNVDAAARATARKLGQEALKLYDREQYADALEKLDTANEIVPTPTLGLYAARCLARMGKLVEASEKYLDVSRMPIARSSPAVFRKAVIDAVTEREKLLPTIPTLDVELEGPRGDGVTLVVDDQPFLVGLLGEKRPVDPGHHGGTAKRGETVVTANVDVKAGDAARLVLTLPPLPPPPPPPALRTPRLRIAGWASVGVGVAGGLLAAVSGPIALVDAHKLGTTRNCVGTTCNSSESGTISGYHAVSDLTTAGIVVGVIGLGVGIPILLRTPKTEWVNPDGTPASPPKEAASVLVEPWVGFGQAGLRGEF